MVQSHPPATAGIRTTATVLGVERSYAYWAACWLGAAAAFVPVEALKIAAAVGIVRSEEITAG